MLLYSAVTSAWLNNWSQHLPSPSTKLRDSQQELGVLCQCQGAQPCQKLDYTKIQPC